MVLSLRAPAALAAVCLVGVALAQSPDRFVELRKQHAPFVGPDPMSGTIGDVDGDGDVDIVAGDRVSRLLVNDGFGVFAEDTGGRIPAFGEDSWTRLLLDVDGDGDLDLVLGSAFGRPGTVLSNDGTGRFSVPASPRLPAAANEIVHIAAADVDVDGDPDLIVVDRLVVRLFVNDGRGTFTDAPGAFGATTVRADCVAVGDVDGDGDPDLVRGWDRTRVHLNDGSGRFAELADAVPATLVQPSALALGDVDGDGDLDLAEVGAVNQATAAESKWFTNDGTGRFALADGLPTSFQAAHVVAFADLDADGDLDLLEAPPNGELLLRRNDGPGGFASIEATSWRSGTNQRWIGIADTDGDGDPDVLAPCWDEAAALDVWINDGSGRLRGGSTVDLSRRVAGVVASGDLDGDGLADVVTYDGQFEVGIALNDGTGELVARPLTAQVRLGDAALFDADGDGDRDLLLVGGSGGFQLQPRLFVNDGRGVFTERSQTQMPPRSSEGRAIEVADRDGDGDLDVLVVGSPPLLLENAGGGRFIDRSYFQLPDPSLVMLCAAWGDVDGDGAVDLVVHGRPAGAVQPASTEVWRNVGLLGFARVPGAFDAAPRSANACVLVDLDRDGDLDCVLGGMRDDGAWINDGSGRFVGDATIVDFRPGEVLDLRFADVDDDGTDELVARTRQSLSQPYRLVHELRTFRDVGASYLIDDVIGVGVAPTAVFDLDGDSDADVTVGGRVLTNVTRQLHAPLAPRAGGRARLAFRALPGGAALAVPLIADAALAVPLATPFGALWLDPGRLVVATAPIAFDTVGALDFVLPNDRALTGVTLHAQALVVDAVGRIRLTSAIAERIVR